MPWEQTVSASFRARHDTGDADDAHGVLIALERARERLSQTFPHAPGDLTVVLHGGPIALALSNPLVGAQWLATAPSGRRYVTGWAGTEVLHVLTSAALRERASQVPGSWEMLTLSATCLYARAVIGANTPELARVMGLIRMTRELRWAWLLEGAARWFGGQTAHARPAIARRLREGRRPAFPPSARDAALLGGTLLDLLASETDSRTVARFACRLHPEGAGPALARVFGRSAAAVEGDWRAHLARLAAAPVGGGPLDGLQ